MTGDRWRLWLDGVHSPADNMAIDECLLESAPEHRLPVLRIYGWDRPAVTFGRFQRYPLDLAANFTPVRRPTGGGVVFHDADLTYTVVVPAGHRIGKLDRMASYRIFHQAMKEHLGVESELLGESRESEERVTMRCFVSPSRFDLVGPAGEKYAGAAQRRTRDGILHQGSIRLPRESGGDGLSKRLTEAFRQAFELEYLPWEPDAAFLEKADRRSRERYQNADWNQGKYAAGH